MGKNASIYLLLIYFLFLKDVSAEKTKLLVNKDYQSLGKTEIDSMVFKAIDISIDSLVNKFELEMVEVESSSDVIINIKFIQDQSTKLSVKFIRAKDHINLEGFLFTIPSIKNNLSFKEKDLVKPFFICFSLITTNRSNHNLPKQYLNPEYSLEFYDIVPKINISNINLVYNSIKESLSFQQDLLDYNYHLFSNIKSRNYFDFRLEIFFKEDINNQMVEVQFLFSKKNNEVVLEKYANIEMSNTYFKNDFLFSSKINRVIKQSLIELFQIQKTN